MREDKKVERRDVSAFLGGNGLPYLVEYLITKKNEQGKYSDSKLLKDKDIKSIRSEDVTEYARTYSDPLCLAAISQFLYYFAHFLFDLSTTFLPFGGIYFMSSVLLSFDFILEAP